MARLAHFEWKLAPGTQAEWLAIQGRVFVGSDAAATDGVLGDGPGRPHSASAPALPALQCTVVCERTPRGRNATYGGYYGTTISAPEAPGRPLADLPSASALPAFGLTAAAAGAGSSSLNAEVEAFAQRRAWAGFCAACAAGDRDGAKAVLNRSARTFEHVAHALVVRNGVADAASRQTVLHLAARAREHADGSDAAALEIEVGSRGVVVAVCEESASRPPCSRLP